MENIVMEKVETNTDKDSTTKDLVIYGYGKIGKAIKLLADRAKDTNLYFTSQIFTVDTNGTAQFTDVSEIKDLPNDLIHIIAIDTGITLDATLPNGYIPDTAKVKELIEEIVSEREATKNFNDIIIIESTVEIGFYDSLKLKETYPNLILIISPERYNEDVKHPDGFTMDKNKLVGVDMDLYDIHNDNSLVNSIEEYLNIFRGNDIATIIAPIKEVEASKVIENAYNYLRYSFVNDLQWNLGSKLDVEMILSLAGTKTEKDLGDLHPGLIGGGCIPIDSLYLPNIENTLIGKVVENENKRLHKVSNMIFNLIEKSKLKQIALMGASYKADSTSTKNSQYLKVLRLVNEKLAVTYSGTNGNKDDAPKIYVLDNLSIDTPAEYFMKENLANFELILIGANHLAEMGTDSNSSTYRELAIQSGTNVFDLNTLAIYKKGN